MYGSAVLMVGVVVFFAVALWIACAWFIVPWERTKRGIIGELGRIFTKEAAVSVKKVLGLIALVKFGGVWCGSAVSGALYFAADSELRLYLKLTPVAPRETAQAVLTPERRQYVTVTASGVQYDGPVSVKDFSHWFSALLRELQTYIP